MNLKKMVWLLLFVFTILAAPGTKASVFDGGSPLPPDKVLAVPDGGSPLPPDKP